MLLVTFKGASFQIPKTSQLLAFFIWNFKYLHAHEKSKFRKGKISVFYQWLTWENAEAYSELFQLFIIGLTGKIFNSWKALTIFAKRFILDAWQGFSVTFLCYLKKLFTVIIFPGKVIWRNTSSFSTTALYLFTVREQEICKHWTPPIKPRLHLFMY